MAKPNVSDLIEQVANFKRESEVDLTDVPQDVRPGRTAAKNAALQAYNDTLLILRGAIGQYTGGIFVTGPGSRNFAEVAEDEAGSLTLDVADMYRTIAEAWYPTVRVDKVFALDCLISFLGGVHLMLPKLGVREIARSEFGKHFGRSVTCLDDAVNVTRDILRETVGDDLNSIYINAALANKAVEEDWDLPTIPVVLVGATEDEINTLSKDLFYGKNVVLEVKNENPDKNEIVLAFKHLRAKMNPAKQPALPLNE